jgi:hypothetical protein
MSNATLQKLEFKCSSLNSIVLCTRLTKRPTVREDDVHRTVTEVNSEILAKAGKDV